MASIRSDDSHQSSQDVRAASTSNSPASPKSNHGRKENHQNACYTPKENNKTANAFDVIMSGGKNSAKKRKRPCILGSKNQASRFLPCPVGCGKHVLPHEMNKHLDACLLRQAMKQQQQQDFQQKSISSPCSNKTENSDRKDEFSSTPSTPIEGTPPEPIPTSTTSSPVYVGKYTEQVIGENERDHHKSPMNMKTEATIGNNYQNQKNNAFAHMMKRSVKVFSEQEERSASLTKIFERIHLHENGRITLTCFRNNRIIPPEEKIAWSATVQVRGKKEGPTPPIDLLLTSSIPSSPERARLVRNHSRLSVPVLKSILQKGIRRRKPLPSVRVASELADKSLGDLLRRLPIIILEDSTLHPSLPFLVWLMMAVSKDFQPPLLLLKRVLGIIFEMASCRWQDSLPTSINNNESKIGMGEQRELLALASLHKISIAIRKSDDNDLRERNKIEAVLNDDELIVWSILMRGQYGGMACDIRMLQGYAELWHERFNPTQRVSDDIKKRLSPGVPASSNNCSTTHSRSPFTATAGFGTVAGQKSSGEDQYLQEWNQIPEFIHKSQSKQSACRVDRLFMSKSVLTPLQPTLIQNKNYQLIEDHTFIGLSSLCKLDLTQEGVDFHCSSVLESTILCDAKLVRECFVRLGGKTDAVQDRRSWLEGLLKSCMWKYSGGVNFRLPLIPTETNEDDADDDLKRFYEAFVRPRVEAFSVRYIDERLSKR